jgi:poly(A) polymerase Pap1
MQALTKLNSYRDLTDLLLAIPNLDPFRLAHRFIKVWAQHRGIYASRFGYLGGFHITLMLSRICKLLAGRRREGKITMPGTVIAADIICTFFNHYANFNWEKEMVVDEEFAGQQRRYRRGAREVMVIVSLHAPRVNVARAASLPAVRTVVGELRRADGMVGEQGVSWLRLIGGTGKEGAGEFLGAYKSYIKINVQYWGLSLAKGSSLVGWLESKCVVLLVGKSL